MIDQSTATRAGRDDNSGDATNMGKKSAKKAPVAEPVPPAEPVDEEEADEPLFDEEIEADESE